MEHFKVDCTTLLSWTIQVQARNAREAREEAQSVAGWIDFPSSLAALHRTEHRIEVVRLAHPDTE
jgi:hypothetical protein